MLAATAVAATALLAPAASADTATSAAEDRLAATIADAQATAVVTREPIEITVPSRKGDPCFTVSVLGPWGAVYITFYQPIVSCVI